MFLFLLALKYTDKILQPAMSNMLRHLPSWDRLIYLVTFGFSGSSASSRGKHYPSNRLSTNLPRARYSDLENGSEGSGLHEYEMAPVKSARTYARTGSSSEVEDDGSTVQFGAA